MMACKELLRRLEPIKRELENPTWKKLVMAAYMKDVDLCARYMCVWRILQHLKTWLSSNVYEKYFSACL